MPRKDFFSDHFWYTQFSGHSQVFIFQITWIGQCRSQPLYKIYLGPLEPRVGQGVLPKAQWRPQGHGKAWLRYQELLRELLNDVLLTEWLAEWLSVSNRVGVQRTRQARQWLSWGKCLRDWGWIPWATINGSQNLLLIYTYTYICKYIYIYNLILVGINIH